MRLVLTGMGLVTSVGRGAPAACAAIRAGLSRPRRCTHYRALSEETQEPLAIFGHPIRGYTEGFTGSGLWSRLAWGSVRDLMGSARLPGREAPEFWRRTGLLCVTPSPVGPRFLVDEGGPSLIEEAFLRPLLRRLGLPLSREALGVGGMEHEGTVAALLLAARLFAQGRVERIILLAVDSYLDSLTLQWLDSEGRLKTEELPTGLMPGEASASLLLETEGSARRRGASTLARVAAMSLAREPNTLASGETNSGVGLATCLGEVLRAEGATERYSGDIVSDLNGETWRAQEWGATLVRLGEHLVAPRLHLPGVSVGDTGAASGALGMCLATHLLTRGHTRSGRVLVTSSSVEGGTGCVALHSATA